ncbi:hypothetical protein METBIDRAFT_39797 [Metschnikowia bicuspidata var. bicuspidata NRRL YB-4993]|uniref:alpha,alpha-trehalase n=1 Tax=Metschnikowia bicuspidata var. bicuspidata NRRL YB-4993 TaxID=869754 RepID=A0A1A0HDY6_9ASCO|nr:hypothetical protein METBIDRAFT_39797 [Metschnikowia bicuspidata var. bicuspidata NRRL YB-4993]OBA22226.1 hypothetical protein METBIDRAFT_39797 [Metschnikowia bicuspidata var. bicuspidata NRRL YB-4993]
MLQNILCRILVYFVFTSIFSSLVQGEAFNVTEIERQISSLKQLADLARNKEIFSTSLFSEHAFFDQTNNVLGTLDFVENHSFQTQPYVANGYFGARIPNLGHGFAYDLLLCNSSAQNEALNNGWPLFSKRFAGAFAAGFFDSQENTVGQNFPWLYQYGWDSVISAIPQWTFLSIAAGKYVLDPMNPAETWGYISNYVQNLSLENGAVSTLFTWLNKLHLEYEIVASKHDINLGTVSLVVRNPSDEAIFITVNDTISFETSKRCDFFSSKIDEEGIQMVVTPKGVNDVYGAIHSRLYLEGGQAQYTRSTTNKYKVFQAINTMILPGESLRFRKLVGIYTTDLDPEIYKLSEDVSLAAKRTALVSNVDTCHHLHNEAWLSSLGHSFLIEFPDSPLLTMASKASVYHINANMREGAIGLTSALSVSGLSSDSYGGQVFWDTDLWILMGILPFNPLVSKSLLSYRIQNHKQAIENVMSESRSKESFKGAIYPWTSGRFGNCTATGPCFDYEYHVNAAIAYSAIQLYLSGLVGEDYLEFVVYPIVYDAAIFFSTFVEFDDNLSQYVTKNLTDPDEFAEFIDNGAYTNAAISFIIRWAIMIAKHLGKSVPSIFEHMVDLIHVPYSPDDDKLVLEYSGMNSSIEVKQADVIMMTYPLENELITDEVAYHNLIYYANKQVSTGPAMTFLIFSIVSSRILEAGCSSESYLLKSIEPFLRGPFAQFLEQSDDNYVLNGGTHPAFPFLTAHGGFLQTILMGILGMKFSYELDGDRILRVLSFKARNLSLFPQGVTFGEVRYLNSSLSISLVDSILTVKNNGPIQGTLSLGSNIKVISNSFPGSQEMKVLEEFGTVSFSVPSRKKADSRSLTECGLSLFINLGAGRRGDVVDLMHDGDNSTFWQAESSEETEVLINFKRSTTVKKGFINWGDLPARKLEIYIHDFENRQEKSLNMNLQKPKEQNFQLWRSVQLKNLDNDVGEFQKVFESDVKITEPFDPQEYIRVRPVRSQNVTEFEFPFPVRCTHILIKFSDSHEKNPFGAKIFDINFFEN